MRTPLVGIRHGIRRRSSRGRGAVVGVGAVRARAGRVNHEGAARREDLGAHARRGVTNAAPPVASVPDDLRPRRMFTAEQIRSALPERGGFGWRDLRISG